MSERTQPPRVGEGSPGTAGADAGRSRSGGPVVGRVASTSPPPSSQQPDTPTTATTPSATPPASGPPVSTPPKAAPSGRRRRGGVVGFLRETVIVVGTALVLSLLIKTFLVQAFYIPSPSMEPALVSGDRVLVSQLTPGPFDLQRGDVVVFRDPGEWLDPTPEVQRSPVAQGLVDALTFVGVLPQDSGEHLIKRVIGLPGDTVACCDTEGRLTVNGEPLDEPYVFVGDEPSEMTFEVTVPEGRLWVMGDHRAASQDSRWHQDLPGQGTVPEDLVVGRAAFVIWPLDRATWLTDSPETFVDVPAARAAD